MAFLKFKQSFQFSVIDLFAVAFGLYCIANASILNNRAFQSNQFFLFILLLIFYFTFKQYVAGENLYTKIKTLEVAICFLALIPVITGILELIGVIPIVIKSQVISGGMHNQGVLANYLATLAPFLFAILILDKHKTKFITYFSLAVLILSMITIVFTAARTSWVACTISFLIILVLHPKTRNYLKFLWDIKKIRILYIGATIVVLSFFALKLYSLKKDSADGRLLIWKNCIEMIHNKPFFGHGYGTYIKNYCQQQINYFKLHPENSREALLADEVYFAFNDYLQILVELGILGLMMFILLLFFIFKQPYKPENLMVTASKVGLFSMLICGLFSYPMETPQNYFLFFLFAAIISSSSGPIFKINRVSSFLSAATLVLIVLSIEFIQLKRFMACTAWQKGFELAGKKENQKAHDVYKNIYPMLEYDPNFLFNYGVVLADMGDFKGSKVVLEKCMAINPSYNLFLNLGKDYENLNDNISAETVYKNASHFLPGKLTPKYSLFELYIKTGKKNNALRMAREISGMKMKVYSTEAGYIKSQVIEFIKKNTPEPKENLKLE